MPSISNARLGITRRGGSYDITVSCDIEWFPDELDSPDFLYNAEVEFWGEDSGLRGGDDGLFTISSPVLGPSGLRDRRPPRYQDTFLLARDEFSLNEDPGGLFSSDTDEVYTKIRLIPVTGTSSNVESSNTVRGRF